MDTPSTTLVVAARLPAIPAMLAAAALSISSSGVALPASSSRALLPSSRAAAASSSRSPLHAARMEMQEIEFIIYPDGRVEERVIGVKGENCQQLTAKLNEALGEVYHTAPTEEMFEQAVELEQEAEVGQEVSAWGQSTWGDSGGGGGGGTSEW